MAGKIKYVKPVLHIDKFFKVADHLIQSGNDELVQVGRAMRVSYQNLMVETETAPVHYEESNNTGSPESYNAPDKCEPEVCD